MTVCDMTTERGCVAYLVDLRMACRKISNLLDSLYDSSHWRRRYARLLREKNCPIMNRRAETEEKHADYIRSLAKDGRDALINLGRDIFSSASYVDANVQRPVLLDLLNVNAADRAQVLPEDGIIEIVFVKGLEDSAMFRGGGCKQGPLAKAMESLMNHEMIHNEKLGQSMQDFLFGKGGMFEFLPTYRKAHNGDFVRNPPKLRLACETDATLH